MRPVKQIGVVMYSQNGVSVARRAIYSPIAPADPKPTLKDLFRGQPAESFSAGGALIWEGDQASQIFDVVEGVLRVYKILPDGRRAIMGFLYPGDVLGVSFQHRSLFTAEAVTPVKVRRFSRDRFFSLVNQSPDLRSQLFALLCDKMSAAHEQMLLLGRKSAEERVVSFLLAIHRKCGEGAEIELPMSRLDMADYLGLTIETVSRMMTSLARRGLIHATGRHRIALRKLSALRDIAGRDEDEDDPLPSPARRAVWPN
jgi:CRP/FNR family transcriptional regulator, anaerobic regulatory protein